MIEIKIATKELIADIELLFCSNPSIEQCSCMWFLIPVKDFHAGGVEGNRTKFRQLLHSEPTPLGLIAYVENSPVGWCAVGPRSRYHRAIRTPTYKGRDSKEDDHVWLVPCFFIREEAENLKLSQALLERAVALAEEYGASAIEGFPFSGTKTKSSGDTQVGVESVFMSCGFTIDRRPSENRVVMRRQLKSTIK